jgi:hypothetical protein
VVDNQWADVAELADALDSKIYKELELNWKPLDCNGFRFPTFWRIGPIWTTLAPISGVRDTKRDTKAIISLLSDKHHQNADFRVKK